MNGGLPARRFREAQLLIGASLVVLVAVAVALLEGVLSVAGAWEAETRRRAVLAAELLTGPRAGFAAPPAAGVLGGVTFADGQVVESWGVHGPEAHPWWPWASRQAWEEAGRVPAGPVRLGGDVVVVVSRPAGSGRVVRVVVAAPEGGLVRRWRWLGGSLALLVAGGGAVVAWLLISRALAPYRELLAEASRVVGQPGVVAEDRFLVDAFRTTIQRLEASEQALRQRAEDLAVLSAGLAHELRNALATVTGYLRLLPGATEGERQEYLAVASQEADNVNELLGRFLTLTQPHTLRTATLRVDEVLEDAVRRVRTVFPGVSFVVRGGGVELTADPMALGVAVENLLRNAAEASCSGAAPVEVTVEETPSGLRLTVEDRGGGVDPDIRAQLFVPFSSTKPSGGLGLALARRMARLHGGDVRYEDREGGGARFVLELPREGKG